MNENLDGLDARLRQSLDARGTAPELSPDIVAGAGSRTAPRLVDTRRRLQAAGGITLAIAAVTVGALVVASPFQQQQPLFTAAGGGGSSGSPMAADESSSSDMRMGAWIDYRYVAGPGLSTSGGNGTVYELRRSGTAEQALRTAANALGLAGTPIESQYSDPTYPMLIVGPEDGSAPSVSISWNGTGSWWYNDPTANPPFECAAVEPGDEATKNDIAIDEPMCATPAPPSPSLAPSESEAKAQARALFAATGLDVAAGDIRVTVDEWQTNAVGSLEVDGVQTAIEWGVGWSSATGRISYAYGHSIEVVDRGAFGTVSPAAAVERLADWRWFGSAGPKYQGGVSIMTMDSARAAEEAAASSGNGTSGSSGQTDPQADPQAPDTPVESPTEPAAPTDPESPTAEPTAKPVPTEEPGEEPGVEPTPGVPTEEPLPLPEPVEPEVVVVTVDTAEKTLLMVWDAAGNVWLVPGYAMKHPEGWWNTVMSVVEGVITLPEPIATEPYMENEMMVR